jgi:tRNA A37 N6-isopentenylltransferase MiaA
MAGITARGKMPLLAGGTMLYFKALREGSPTCRRPTPRLRARDRRRSARAAGRRCTPSWPGSTRRAAARLTPTDAQRIQRALEVCASPGADVGAAGRRASAAAALPPHSEIALLPSDRAVLHERIAQRFDAMLDAGLDRRSARAAPKIPPAPRPAVDALRRLPPGVGLPGRPIDRAELREKGIAATRQLAKRQLTWLRRAAPRGGSGGSRCGARRTAAVAPLLPYLLAALAGAASAGGATAWLSAQVVSRQSAELEAQEEEIARLKGVLAGYDKMMLKSSKKLDDGTRAAGRGGKQVVASPDRPAAPAAAAREHGRAASPGSAPAARPPTAR